MEKSRTLLNLREKAETFDGVLYRRIVREHVHGLHDPLLLSHRGLLSVSRSYENGPAATTEPLKSVKSGTSR